ncbi:hypothetical protein [Gilliamella sp. W8128]|uniref:hypothetical protein n=1 Tax=Gilliamella sp. W8128 TaxID=2751010 RepID=UPI0018DB6CA2|nr:hypothetical protein [Gilliamella sp. W8128]MBI0154628.1 hypothetical protein [Gilliamella sp. W8128]
MVLVLTMVVLQSISFANYALTTKTTNIIQGSAPYLTFDGGRTRATNTEALLGISLSDGRTFTPTANDSSLDNPIVLPVAGQSFNDIGMFIPTDTDSIELSSVIGAPNNYWGDDDGDGQGIDGVSVSGGLSLSIVDKYNQAVARKDVLSNCNAPYKITLISTDGTLSTQYGVPNQNNFNASNATYYITPKLIPEVCFAKPSLEHSGIYDGLNFSGSADIWKDQKGFIVQSTDPSSYNLNFPTTGANNLIFDLEIVNGRALSWAPVTQSKITATITPNNSTGTSVKVTLTGPFAKPEQWDSDSPGHIFKPNLPQVFELVGRDNNGNAVVKYGFVLKQWFVNRSTNDYSYSNTSRWCSAIGYNMPKVEDLTNAACLGLWSGDNCEGSSGASPASDGNYYKRQINAGLFAEWGNMYTSYKDAEFGLNHYWTLDTNKNGEQFGVYATGGGIFKFNSDDTSGTYSHTICVAP